MTWYPVWMMPRLVTIDMTINQFVSTKDVHWKINISTAITWLIFISVLDLEWWWMECNQVERRGTLGHCYGYQQEGWIVSRGCDWEILVENALDYVIYVLDKRRFKTMDDIRLLDLRHQRVFSAAAFLDQCAKRWSTVLKVLNGCYHSTKCLNTMNNYF